MKIKCCRTCKECVLDIKALRACRVLVDRCKKHDKSILHPWLRGFFCKDWEEEKPIVFTKDNYFVFEVDDIGRSSDGN